MTSRAGSLSEFATWTRRVVAEPHATAGDPRRWFDSDQTARRETVGTGRAEAVVTLLSEDTLALLRLIEQRRPRSLRELAELAGRSEPNLSRTLKKLAAFGIVGFEPGERRMLAPRLLTRRITLDLDLIGRGSAMSLDATAS